jgi:hypothetical protein
MGCLLVNLYEGVFAGINEMAMALVEPSRKHFAAIVDKMRESLGVKGIPKWFRYTVCQEGNSNKYHYFAVFVKDDGTFVGANGSGRIGYNPQVHVISQGTYNKVEDAVISKYKNKITSGRNSGSWM